MMAKNKKKTNNEVAVNESLKSMKQGFVQKKKNHKFKQTPTGKVALINGTNKQSNSKQQKGGKNSPNSNKKNQNGARKALESKKLQKAKKEEEEEESDEDYNEGIVLKEQNSFGESDDVEDDEEESNEEDIPNILGASLAENSDDDDEDFEKDESDDTSEENKGVKKFKGSLRKSGSSNSNKEESSDDNISGTDLNTSSSLMNSELDSSDDDDEDEDEDDDEESDESEDEEGDDSTLGLKALLGNNLADDDDDKDFDDAEEDDEDEEMSDEDEEDEVDVKPKKKGEKASPEKKEADENTIYVGNIPIHVKKEQLEKLFEKFGKIASIRARGIIAKDSNMSKKVAAITNKTHPKIKTFHAYVVFVKKESVEKALSLKGTKFEGNYLIVDKAVRSENFKYDPKKCVFIGNLSFKLDLNTVWDHFKSCGEIESVRLIKDKKTGIGRGFGYVNFKSEDAVHLALEMNGTQILNREVRVRICTSGSPVKNEQKQAKKRSVSTGSEENLSPTAAATEKENPLRRKKQKLQNSPEKKNSPKDKVAFQGQKADAKKKGKVNKLKKRKEVLAKKLTAKPKKSPN